MQFERMAQASLLAAAVVFIAAWASFHRQSTHLLGRRRGSGFDGAARAPRRHLTGHLEIAQYRNSGENNKNTRPWNPPEFWSRGDQGISDTSGSLRKHARAIYDEISAGILARWGSEYANTTLFSGGMVFSDGGVAVVNKMLDAVLDQDGFVTAFTGISTTAGHDCLYEQSYPYLFNKTMGKLMAAAGVRFEAINVAMGNTRVAPYSWCVDAHAGLEADIISWDMSMMVAGGGCGKAASLVELFIRSASVLPRRPAVLLMDASPTTQPCATPNPLGALERNCHRFITGQCDSTRSLMEVYRAFGLHQLAPSYIVVENTCGDDRFAFEHLYNASEKSYPKPARWHAAPAGHLLLADMLFMHYAALFLSALDRLEVLAPDASTTALRKRDAQSMKALRDALGLDSKALSSANTQGDAADEGRTDGQGAVALPPPTWCAGWRFCDMAGYYRCATSYTPLGGRGGSNLMDMVSNRTTRVLNNNFSEYLALPAEGRWALTLNEDKPNVLRYLSTPSPTGMHLPVDKKRVLVGDALSGPIEFEFETKGATIETGAWTEDVSLGDPVNVTNSSGLTKESTLADGRVAICKPDFIDHARLNDMNYVRFNVDGLEAAVLPVEQPNGMIAGACVLLDTRISRGRHVLAVEPLSKGPPFVAISHLLYPQ